MINIIESKNFHLITSLVLTMVITCIYGQVLSFDFLNGWDDQVFVVNFYTSGGLSTENIFRIFTDFYAGQYAPINQIYYSIIFTFFEYQASIYHLFGIVLHVIDSILVYFFIVELFRRIFVHDLIRSRIIGLLTALFFAVLPINTEPVAWISASKVTLYALFYLLALIFYLRYLRNWHLIDLIFCMVLFCFSFGAKEQALILPAILVLLDYLKRRPMLSVRIWLEKLPFVLISVILYIITIHSRKELSSDFSDFYPFAERLLIAPFTLSEYLTKIITPVNLSYYYPFPYEIGDRIPDWLWIYPICLVLLGISIFKFFKNPLYLFCICFFLLHLAPVINFIPLARYSLLGDRYAYVGTIGICNLLAVIISKTAFSEKSINFRLIVGLLYFIILSVCSWSRLPAWKNVNSLKAKVNSVLLSSTNN